MAKNDTADAIQNTALSMAQNAPAINPTHHLIVIHPFGSYSKGARIEDAVEIATVIAGENSGSCNRILAGA